MKVVQTKLNNLEYELLRRYAESRGLTIMEALREIVRKHLLEEEVDQNDPFFVEGPLVKKKGVVDKTSIEHDKILYGE
ncbi:MAG: hypothetical protein ACTSYM_07390 [Candidatus Baldrarchaeia archaeon]|nr:hypothetical protein [Candidatus Baldrarchaeota archaeon]MDO8045397.1 hypothetical protein [Candidatus Baldrarchaeota archaeon]